MNFLVDHVNFFGIFYDVTLRWEKMAAGETLELAAVSSSAGAHGSILQATADQLLVEVKREAEETGRLSEDLLSALLFVFQAPLHQALDLLDRGAVTRYHCSASRELYRVRGTGGRFYTCMSSSDYCSCPSFVYTVLVKQDSLLCKHLLAVRLGRAMAAGKRERREGEGGLPTVGDVCVTDVEWGRMLVTPSGELDTSELADRSKTGPW